MPRLVIENSSATLSLESQLDRLVLEASVLSNVLDTFRNVLPNLNNKISDILSTFTNSDKDISGVKALISEIDKFNNKKDHVDFVTYSKTLVSVPEGFTGTINDYLTTINEVNSKIYIRCNNMLTEYSSILSSYITNKEDKISMKLHNEFYKYISKERTEFTNSLDAYFNNKTISKAYLNNVLTNFSEVNSIKEQLTKLNKSHNKTNLSNILQETNKVVSMLDIIIDNSKDASKVSSESALNISKGAYELAKFIELISIFNFRIIQAITTTSKLIDTLNKIVK